MGWAAIFQAIAQGLTNAFSTYTYIKENKQQAREIAEQAQEQADARARKAKTLMNQQKTSYLKAGVYFDSGTPVDIIEETYETAMDDINAINKDSLSAQKKLIRAGRTAFFTFMIDPASNNGSNYAENIYKGFSQQNSNNQFASTNNVNTSAASTSAAGAASSTKLTSLAAAK